MDLRAAVRIVSDSVEEWYFVDDGREYNYCGSCGWDSRDDYVDRLDHKPGCELRAALDFIHAYLKEE